MSSYWLLFASLTVVGSLVYNVTMKYGATQVNAFAFVLIVSFVLCVVQAISFLVAKCLFKIDVLNGLSIHGIMLGVVCGFSVALIDIAYFFALRYGSAISSQAFWTIGGMIALTVFAVLVFKETLTPVKALGIILGIISLFLMTRGNVS